MLSICHGSAALLKASMNEKDNDFIYDGYIVDVFTDSVDKQTPKKVGINRIDYCIFGISAKL